MKTFKNIFIILLASITLYSCDDATDIFEPGIQDDSATFNTVSDLQSGLDGVYITLDLTQDIFFNSNYSDEVTRGLTNGGQGINGFNFFQATNLNEPFIFWSKYYNTNMIASRIIEAASLVTPEAGEQAQYNNIIGSLKAIRAYSHFMLFAYYTPDYTNESGLSIPIIDFVPSVELNPTRNTVAEVTEYMNTELAEAQSLLTVQSDPNFISRDFVTALRARFAAYRQDYTTARNLAENLLASYPISTPTQFESMFGSTGHNTAEVIFQLSRTPGDRYDRQSAAGGNGSVIAGGRAGNVFAFTNVGPNGGPFFQMNRALFNLYDEDDIRYQVYIHPASTINPNWSNDSSPNDDIIVIDKYPGKDGTPLLADLKVFRSAEMLLIAAEAYIHDNQLGQAAILIQQLRNARLTSGTAPLPSYGSQQAAYLDLVTERRKELAFEAHRFFDIKRLGTRAGQGLDRAVNECNFHGWAVCDLPANDYRFTLPIPQAELDGNPEIGSQQNPGY